MSKLTDFEIKKRIAEIEGVFVAQNIAGDVLLYYEDNIIQGVWNPFEAGACHRLIDKHRLHVNPVGESEWSCCDGAGHYENYHVHEKLNYAVALTLLEMFKDKL